MQQYCFDSILVFALIFLVKSQIAVIFGSLQCLLFFALSVLFVPPGTLSCYFAQSAECDRWLDLKLGAARELLGSKLAVLWVLGGAASARCYVQWTRDFSPMRLRRECT